MSVRTTVITGFGLLSSKL